VVLHHSWLVEWVTEIKQSRRATWPKEPDFEARYQACTDLSIPCSRSLLCKDHYLGLAAVRQSMICETSDQTCIELSIPCLGLLRCKDHYLGLAVCNDP